MKKFQIHSDIRQSSTLPGSFYRSAGTFENVRDRIFANCWQYVANASEVVQAGQVYPFTLLPGVFDEPLLFTRDRDHHLHCLSNVCTHRGKILVEKAGTERLLSCRYHGRCFSLDGRFRSMPAFESAENFPAEADHLPRVAFAEWLGLLFVSLQPKVPFAEMVRPIQERLSWLPLDQLQYEPRATVDYLVKANWALYVDNYLEGFHIPFVHPALNQALELEAYGYELYPYCNLQIGIAAEGTQSFDIPASAPDAGKKILAYYWWLFPNLMINVYPWGISLNSIEPLDHQNTLVRFRSYYFPGFPYREENLMIHQTEMEDESVVESVQLGIQSRFYQQGRFSPTMEKGVHHFHRLIQSFLAD